jgi:hypothetical protein
MAETENASSITTRPSSLFQTVSLSLVQLVGKITSRIVIVRRRVMYSLRFSCACDWDRNSFHHFGERPLRHETESSPWETVLRNVFEPFVP